MRQRTIKVLAIILTTIILPGISVAYTSTTTKIDGNSIPTNAEVGVLTGKAFSDGPVLITRKDITLYDDNPTKIELPVFAATLGTKGAKMSSITVLDAFGKERGRLDTNVEVKSIASIAPSLDAAIRLADAPKDNRYEKLFETGYYTEVTVDLTELSLKPGDSQLFTIKAVFDYGEEKLEMSASTLVTIASLPSRPGWYGGDGHIHTSWSPDMIEETIAERATYAANNGFGWIIITDHEDGIENEWPNYVAQCDTAQSNEGIIVAPGAEIAVLNDKGHTLGYWLSMIANNVPSNQQYSQQDLIDEINNHNSPYSYTVIAHPYHSKVWGDWTATGFRAIELMSNQTRASSQTISKWFSLLNNGLASAINGQGFVVGIANSDCHFFMAPGEDGFTWAYVPSYSSSNRSYVWTAIKQGRVSACGNKDLGVFSINNVAQGSVINATSSTTLNFKLIQQPVTGRKCTRITVYENSETKAIKTITNPTTTETTFSIPAPSSDSFYVTKFEFTNVDGSNLAEVWANPIFVNR
ncbi:MAG TPA: hypothetical protein GXX19_05535 [Syntrophomonadaceae bacterium]|nr:hypothetical protein [Syntrophomonadaceae bacterium]